jgi:hypothetical protein
LRIGQLRTVIALLLATVPWSVLAQTAQDENLKEVISKLRACVRTYAPAAQAAGMQNTSDAINFFIETCTPPLTVSALINPGAAPRPRPGMLSLSDYANVGAVPPPGIFRRVIGEEWPPSLKKHAFVKGHFAWRFLSFRKSPVGTFQTCRDVQLESVMRFKADVRQRLSFYGFTVDNITAWQSPVSSAPPASVAAAPS